MRDSLRHRLAGTAVVLSAAALLTGCFAGGRPAQGNAAVTPPAAAPSPSARPTPA